MTQGNGPFVSKCDGVCFAGLGVDALVVAFPTDVQLASYGRADLYSCGLAVLPGKFLQNESAAAAQTLD